MTSIDLTAVESPGGIKTIEIYKISDVKNCPFTITENNVSNLVFQQTNNDLTIYPVSNDMEFTENPTMDKGGALFNVSGGFVVKSQNTVADTYFYAVTAEPVMVRVFYLNGNKRLFGSVNSPLSFNYQPYNGKSLENGSGYRVTVGGKTTQKPVYFT